MKQLIYNHVLYSSAIVYGENDFNNYIFVYSVKEWQRIFHHHCPDKIQIPKTRLTTQKYNFIKQKYFDEEELQYMNDQIKTMFENQVCPIENPIPLPVKRIHQPNHQTPGTPILTPTTPDPELVLQRSPHQSPQRSPVYSPNATPASQHTPDPVPSQPTSPRSSPEPAVAVIDIAVDPSVGDDLANIPPTQSQQSQPESVDEDVIKDELVVLYIVNMLCYEL